MGPHVTLLCFYRELIRAGFGRSTVSASALCVCVPAWVCGSRGIAVLRPCIDDRPVRNHIQHESETNMGRIRCRPHKFEVGSLCLRHVRNAMPSCSVGCETYTDVRHKFQSTGKRLDLRDVSCRKGPCKLSLFYRHQGGAAPRCLPSALRVPSSM